MAELKTKPTKVSVEEYIGAIDDPQRKADCSEVAQMMAGITGDRGTMWGPSIAGFGRYQYQYKSGQKGEWMITGFSSRKQNLTLYIMSDFKKHNELMKKLGKYKTGKSCLYIKHLDDIDRNVLKELIAESVEHLSADKAVDYS